MVKFKIIILSICILFQFSISGQNFNFDYPEFEVNISPTAPGICSQNGTDVTCLEDCISYTWEMKNAIPEFEVLYGQTVTLTFPGSYILTVEKDIENVICTKQFAFDVLNLTNIAEIEKYLIGNGFYGIPIILDEEAKPSNGIRDDNQCTNLNKFKFASEHEFIDLETSTVIEDVISNFRSVKDILATEKVNIITQNECLCTDGIESFESPLELAKAGLWTHIFEDDENPGASKLYLKGKIPGRDKIPANENEKETFIGFTDLVIQSNSTTQEAMRVFSSNNLMYAQLFEEEFEEPNQGSNCGLTANELAGRYIFTPAGVPIKFPSAASNPTFGNNLSSGAFPGALASFIYDQKTWRSHYQPLTKGNIFKGYYTREKARFSDETDSGECPFCFDFIPHDNGINVPYVLPIFNNFDSECEMTRAIGIMNSDLAIDIYSTSGGFDDNIISNIKSSTLTPGLGYFDVGSFNDSVDICATPTSPSTLFNSDNFDYISCLGDGECDYTGRYVIMKGKGPIYEGKYFAIMSGFDDGSISNTYELVNNCWVLSPEIPVLSYEYVDVILWGIHAALDCIGVVPVLGIPADITNAWIYIVEGDETNAAISIAGAVLEGAIVGRYLDEAGGYLYDITGSKRFIHNSSSPGKILQNGKYLTYKNLDGEISVFPIQKIGKILTDVSSEERPYALLSEQLIDDINALPLLDQKKFFIAISNQTELVKAWEVFFPDQAVRTNITWLQKLDGYFTSKPNKLDEVTNQFSIEKGKNRVTAYLKGLLERKHYDGEVYRGDKASVTPTQAFNDGIPAKGGHDNLIKHLDGGDVNKGDFVSTSKDISIANDFAGNNGYVYKVKSRNGKGVDVNETLGDEVDNWFPEQLEVSMSGGIDKADIIGAYPKGQYSDADFIPNPNYVP